MDMYWWMLAPWWAKAAITAMAIPYTMSLIVLWIMLVDWLAGKIAERENRRAQPKSELTPTKPPRVVRVQSYVGHVHVGMN